MLLPAAAVAALSLLPTTLALDWFGPRPTPTRSQPDAQGWTPKPTEGPQYNVVAANPGLKLFRRQSYQFRYPNTCGYVDGNGAYSFTCDGAFGCAFNSAKFAFGCTSTPTPSPFQEPRDTHFHLQKTICSCCLLLKSTPNLFLSRLLRHIFSE